MLVFEGNRLVQKLRLSVGGLIAMGELPVLQACPYIEAYIIDRNCSACHGIGLSEGSTAPGLLERHWKYATDHDSLQTVISNGLVDRGMPANPQLKPQEMRTLIHYLRESNR